MDRIFHIALESAMYSSNAISKGFIGKTVMQFNWQQVTYEYDRQTMREMSVKYAADFKPDLIFLHCQNPAAFDLDTIIALQAIAPVVNYTFDVRQDISWFKGVAPHITLTVFACKEDVNDCKNSDIPNVAYLPSSADYEFYRQYLHFRGRSLENRHEIVFIGNDTLDSNLAYPLAQQRRDMIKFMYDKFPRKFMAYGMGQKGGLVSRDHELQIYSNSKIAITHNHFIRTGYCSDRDWRAVGCGPLVVHHWFEGVFDLFGKSAIVWNEFEDIQGACEYFLSHIYERTALSEKEYEHVLTNHSWSNRIDELFTILKQQTQPA